MTVDTTGRRIVLASGNRGKLEEIQRVLAADHREWVSQAQFHVPEADETGLTFVENAIIKARNAAAFTGLPALADDSGLEVDALGGAPGIYSARYAGPGKADAENNAKLLAVLSDVSTPAERAARFRCVMVFMRHPADPAPVIAEGVWVGHIALASRGEGGFGYDPVFVPEGCGGRHAAELPAEEKDRLSHRGQALAALRDLLERA